MSKKRHSPGPVPSSNRANAGPSYQSTDEGEAKPGKTREGGAEAFQEEDPQRAIGDYTGTADHSRQQPGPLNDGGKRHSEDKA